MMSCLLSPMTDLLFLRVSREVFVGGRKLTQPVDIGHAAHSVIEKGLDRRSLGCVGQADIRKFYDKLRLSLICDFLNSKLVQFWVGYCDSIYALK